MHIVGPIGLRRGTEIPKCFLAFIAIQQLFHWRLVMEFAGSYRTVLISHFWQHVFAFVTGKTPERQENVYKMKSFYHGVCSS